MADIVVIVLRKTGEGTYATIVSDDRPDEPEQVKKASKEVATEALAHAKRLAEERNLHLPEIASEVGDLLTAEAFRLADEEGIFEIRGLRLPEDSPD